ncbi:MAG TPA: peptidase M1 [Deltaproteobacteria bacterium]|nr:peptidase M1 [Deltaproteobacteria bacterium]
MLTSLALSPLLQISCSRSVEPPAAVLTETTPDPTGTTPAGPPETDWERDVLHTQLELDLLSHLATARITFEGSTSSSSTSLDVYDLDIIDVTGPDGPLSHLRRSDHLDLELPSGSDPVTVDIRYNFDNQISFVGWMPELGVSYLFPDHCGHLFPCRPDPSEGSTFSMSLRGVGDQIAIYPEEIPAEAPSYMLAMAVGDYEQIKLGTTTAGTSVNAWHLPGSRTRMLAGASHMVEIFDFYEQTYGPYLFGDEVGTVEAPWGGNYGGAEHHPYWHVSDTALSEPGNHAKEAAHGWFGNGVRLGCWEDLVLSDGVASYLAAHAVEELGLYDPWPLYGDWIADICSDPDSNTVAMPSGCSGAVNPDAPLWSAVPHVKGTCFLEDVGDLIGIEQLDQTLAAFYEEYRGRPAQVDHLLLVLKDLNRDHTDALDLLIEEWLTTEACPTDAMERCSGHAGP